MKPSRLSQVALKGERELRGESHSNVEVPWKVSLDLTESLCSLVPHSTAIGGSAVVVYPL